MENEVNDAQSDGSERIEELNAWQVEGKYMNYAFNQTIAKKMVGNEALIYLALVRTSFGYGNISTKMSEQRLEELTGLTRKTGRKYLHSLQDKKYIKRIENNQGMGAKQAYEYQIVFQDGLGVNFKERKNKPKPISKDTEKLFDSLPQELKNRIETDITTANKSYVKLGHSTRANIASWLDDDRNSGKDIYLHYADVEEYYRVHPDRIEIGAKEGLISPDGTKIQNSKAGW